MNVKSYWIPQENLSEKPHVGAKVHMINPVLGQLTVIGAVSQIDPERGALVQLSKPMPWQTLENWGVGWSQFEDTED